MRALGLRGRQAQSPGEAVGRLLALQAQDHHLARWSVAQRVQSGGRADIDGAFDRGEMIRTHVLRPTWHYVSPDDLRWLVRFSGPRVYARTTRYFQQFGLDPSALARSTDAMADAVRDGPRTRSELGATLAARGMEEADGARLAALVMHAELHMAVCSGPMRRKQHTYAAFDDRARGDGPEGDEALAALAQRYFTTRGPATVKDFTWWAGLRAGEARRGLDLVASDLHFRELDGRRYAYADHDPRGGEDRIDFVQCYDEAVVSYSHTRDVLKTPEVCFDPPRRIDGFSHVILRNGQLLGHWRLARSGAIETRVTGRLTSATHDALAAGIEELHQFLVGPSIPAKTLE